MTWGFNSAQGTLSGFSRSQGGTVASYPAQAAHLTPANSEHFTVPLGADNFGSASGWWRFIRFRMDVATGTQRIFWLRPGTTGMAVYHTGGTSLVAEAYDDVAGLQTATDASGLSIDTWYNLYVEYTGTRLRTSVDDAAFTASGSDFTYAPPASGTGYVGATSSLTQLFDGRLQLFCGGDGVLTSAQITELNSGISFSSASAGLVAAATWWNDMGETSAGTGAVTRVDSIGSNDLTDVNTVPSVGRDS